MNENVQEMPQSQIDPCHLMQYVYLNRLDIILSKSEYDREIPQSRTADKTTVESDCVFYRDL